LERMRCGTSHWLDRTELVEREWIVASARRDPVRSVALDGAEWGLIGRMERSDKICRVG
jgi:hypothetical protein